MPIYHMRLPKLGESVTEATIISWMKTVGDDVAQDETLLEIATDKVDSELPALAPGRIVEIHVQVDEVIQVGGVLASIEVSEEDYALLSKDEEDLPPPTKASATRIAKEGPPQLAPSTPSHTSDRSLLTPYTGGELERSLRPSQTTRFYSPLVRSIASIEGLGVAELDKIPGTGHDGRVTRQDIESYLQHRSAQVSQGEILYDRSYAMPTPTPTPTYDHGDNIDIIPMDRRRKLIAEHMVRSKRTSPHVTSFLEIDVTDLVAWRDSNKITWQERTGEKLTYTPLFLRAVARAITDFPRINASVDGTNIILKNSINIGMATATEDDQLVVPVIKDADQLSLEDLSTSVNDLAQRARTHDLQPDEVSGGTFTVTNVGSFGNTLGTPIINQPQVAILSLGAIRRRPGVVDRDGIESIEVRSMMFLSLSYDHRIVDGALGGRFLRRVGDYLEEGVELKG